MKKKSNFRTSLGKDNDSTVLLFIWLGEIHNFSILPQDEERKLIELWQKQRNFEARDKLIRHNLKFATWLAKKFRDRGVEYLDLIQEATIGLIISIDKFDLNLPFKLISCASWWIKFRIHSCIRSSGNSVYIPQNIYALISKIQKIKRKLYQEFGRWPSADEIADEGNLSLKEVIDILAIIKRRYISLNSSAYENKDGKETPFSFFVKGSCLNPETILLAKEEIREVKKVVKNIKLLLKECRTISERQRLIFLLRYRIEKIEDDPQKTALEDVGKNNRIKITREGVKLSIESTWHKLHMAGLPKKINHDWLIDASEKLYILKEATISL